MFSTRAGHAELGELIDRVIRGPESNLEERLRLLDTVRASDNGRGAALDRYFVEEVLRLRAALDEARLHQGKLRKTLATLTASPWHPGVFLGAAMTAEGERALVLHAGARRVVPLADDLPSDDLAAGDEVLLANGLNVVLARSPYQASQTGETARFERFQPDGRAVVTWRDEECVVALGGAIDSGSLRAGDRVRWDRTAWMALEKIDRPEGSSLFLEDTPPETFDGIGGLDRQIAELQRTIALHRHHADVVRRYHLPRKGSVLLVGPPGTGKTMIARALANWLSTLSPSGRARFMSIKPGALHSVWYSQSEANYREAFRVAREAGEREPDVPVVMFFDEVDAVGAARGQSLLRVDDRVQTAFMTELDGLEGRGNILVVAATNRRDAIDPALLRPGRLGDLVLDVPRPDARGAAAILRKYITHDLPLTEGDDDPARAANAVIATAVSRLYASSGDADIATLFLRDGRRRTVAAREVMSGATLAKIARSAIERACWREIETGEGGLDARDVLTVIDDEMAQMARVLTAANARMHVSDLPQDVDVVRVEPVVRAVPRPLRYVAPA